MSTPKKILSLLFTLTATAAFWMLNRPVPQASGSALRSQTEKLEAEKNDLSIRVEALSQERQNLHTQVSALQTKVSQLTRALPNPAKDEAGAPPSHNPPPTAHSEIKTAGDDNPFASAVLALATRAAELNRYFIRMPEKEIPELQYLDEGDWLHLAKDAHLDSPEGIREALADVRQQAKVRFAPMLTSALAGFFKDNNGQPPLSLQQLKPYFTVPVDDATLSRYQIFTDASGKQNLGSATVLKETAPVDTQYDSHFEIGLTGWSATKVRESYSENRQ